MRAGSSKKNASPPQLIRVAIYTRKSTEEGLDQEFNSLHAQRQAIEAYIVSQRGEGWMALPDRYDDGGFSGSNINRPAFQRLLQDIRDRKIDHVCVYKIDRLSRSLLDFARIIEFFAQHHVTFTAITQQFNTADSMGKLTLNILMSFAEFERQVISERTRDKMSATRKRGHWTGGPPPLGYDLVEKKLKINKAEAARVRKIFKLYLEQGSLLTVVEELDRLGWTTKTYTTKKGKHVQGKPFDKNILSRLIQNALYIGRMHCDGQLYKAEHKAIIDRKTWDAVQSQLDAHRVSSRNDFNTRGKALLCGLVRCGVCGASFTPHYSQKNGRRYSFYVCNSLHRQGAAACKGSRVRASDLEQFVVEQIQSIGKDPRLVTKAMTAARKEIKERKPSLRTEIRRLEREKGKLAAERKNIVDAIAKNGNGSHALMERLSEVENAYDTATAKVQEAQKALTTLESKVFDEGALKTALEGFMPIWDELFPLERRRILHLLIENISYHAKEGSVEITFRPEGVRALVAENEEDVV